MLNQDEVPCPECGAFGPHMHNNTKPVAVAMPEVLADIRKSVMEFVGVNRGKVTYWRAGPDRVIANFNAAIDRAAAKVSQEPAVDRSELRERIVDLLCEWVKDVPSKSDLTSSGDIADRILALPGIVPPAAAQDARLRRAALAVLAKWQEKGPFSPIGEMSALALALGHEQPAHERDDAAWAREAAPAPAAPAPYEINFDEVICPACCHQFRAIPVNVQRELNALRDMDEKAQGDEKLRRLRDEVRQRNIPSGANDPMCWARAVIATKQMVCEAINDILAEPASEPKLPWDALAERYVNISDAPPSKPDVPPEPTCGQCRNWSPR